MLWAFAILVLCVLAASLMGSKPSRGWPTFPTAVLTKHEQPAYWHLKKALPDHVVLAQVQLSRMLIVKARAGRQAWQNKIDKKSADFVVCRPDFSVLAVIELDDSTHDTDKARKRDADKDAALSAAGIRVIRWRRLPEISDIRRQVEESQKSA